MTNIKSDLPTKELKTNEQMIAYFDSRFKTPLEFAANDFDAVIGFFLKRGFEKTSAQTIAQVLLTQAKQEDVKIFKLLDKLAGYNKTQLTSIILNVINTSRDKTSQLGFRNAASVSKLEERNIGDMITKSDRFSSLNFTSIVNTTNKRIGIVNNQKILLTNDTD
jgi:hypothetical protein